MPGTTPDPFKASQRGAFLFAAAFVGVALVALLWISANGPSGELTCEQRTSVAKDGAEVVRSTCSGGHGVLDLTWQTALANVAATLLAVGAISLILDFALRRRYGTDLTRYLGIKESMVKSGLSSVSTAGELDLAEQLSAVDSLIYLGRSPHTWLNANLPTVLKLAAERKLAVTIGLPNPASDSAVSVAAEGLGIDAAVLKSSLEVFTAFAEDQWKNIEPTASVGTTLKVVHVDSAPSYDVLHAPGIDAVYLSKPANAGAGDHQIAMTFEDGDPLFPRGWLEAALAPLASANGVIDREKKKKADGLD